MLNEHERAKVLIEALPYIKHLSGYTIVIKYGGSVMINDILKSYVINDIIFFSYIGLNPIVVHGGGYAINSWLEKLHIKPSFKNGIRVTDNKTMEVVEMVLAGKINKQLVTLLNISGGNAVGLCGKDGSLVLAKPLNAIKMGFVGKIISINIKLISLLVYNSYIPVIASIGYDVFGQTYNINADTLASRVAVALNSEKLVFLTDMPGILMDINNPTTLIRSLDIQKAYQLEKKAIISGGMIPKVHSCIFSLEHGVISTHIIDGRVPHSLLLSILTDKGSGSTLTQI